MIQLEALRLQYPLIALLVELLVVGILVGAIWFVLSGLFALVYAASKDTLERGATSFLRLSQRVSTFGHAVWRQGVDALEAFIEQLSLKWVFVEQDALASSRITDVKRTIFQTGQRVGDGLGEMRSSMDAFRSSVDALAVPDARQAMEAGQASTDQIREAAAKRRNAVVMFVIMTPLLVMIVVLNTTMLTKFFESFIDEWISFRWGIKVSMVLGLFFSAAEIGLGILLYYAGQAKESRNVLSAAMQLLWIFLIALLAMMEAYLYYRLSLEMTADRIQPINDSLPAFIHGSWLAAFGPVLTILLSGMGHQLIGALNRFVDGGLQRSQQKMLDEMRQTWTSLMKSGTDLQRRIAAVKQQCSQFIEELSDGDKPSSAVSVLDQALGRLSAALEAGEKLRLKPYADVSRADARQTLALYTVLAAALALLVFIFGWVQFLYGGMVVIVVPHPLILIGGALIQGAGILVASYKVHSAVVLMIDGQPAEVLQGSKESWTKGLAILTLAMVVLYNMALGGAFTPEPFQWIPFLLAMICVAFFALIGRTLPLVAATFKLWLRVIVTVLIALVVWSIAFACWLARVALLLLVAIFYVLAYPFFLVLWKRMLRPDQKNALEHA